MLPPVIRLALAVAILGLTVPLSAQEIHQAVQAGDLDRVAALVDADPASLQLTNEDGLTPLGLAIISGSREMIDHLLVLGADPNGAGGRVLTAIDLAFVLDCQRGSDLTRVLIAGGGRLVPDAPFPYPISRLHLTANWGRPSVARLLLELGVDPDLRGRGNETTMAAAARGGHLELLEVLLEYGANPELADASGNTPLSWAVERGRSDVVELLLERGARIDFVKPEVEQNLLHLASLGGQLDIVTEFVESGIPVSAPDALGHTPLYYAGEYGHKSIADLLLANGAERSELEAERYGRSHHLDREIRDGEAALWYLFNRGWTVRTSDHLLVFDAEEFGVTRPTDPALANGFLTPWEIGDQDVVAMYTCYHGEIGEPAYIHEIEDSLENVIYVQNAGDRWRGSDRSVYLSPRESASLDGGHLTVIGTMTEMATLGHLVEIDGLVIYYQGFRPDDMEYYRGELDFLSTVTDRVDLAFLPIPDPDGEIEESGLKAFVERFQPGAIAFLDPSRREDLYPVVAEQIRAWGYDPDFLLAQHPGDVFVMRRD